MKKSALIAICLCVFAQPVAYAVTNEIRWAFEDTANAGGNGAIWEYAEAYDGGGSTMAKIFDVTIGGDFCPATNFVFTGTNSMNFSCSHDGISVPGAYIKIATSIGPGYTGYPPYEPTWTDAYTGKDISGCNKLNFWIKFDGSPGVNLDVSLFSSGGTETVIRVNVTNYGCKAGVTSWQEVIIPIIDIMTNEPTVVTSDIAHVGFTVNCEYVGDFTVLIDDIRFKTYPIPPVPVFYPSVSISGTEIDLSWNNVLNEKGFTLYRSTNSSTNTAAVVTNLPANTTNFADIGLVVGETYYYWIKAYSEGGDNGYSGVEINSTISSTPPSPPVGLSIRVLSTNRIRLSWNKMVVLNYNVYRSVSSTTNSAMLIHTTLNNNFTNYLDSTLDRNTLYYFWVKSTNAIGLSAFPASVSAVTYNAVPIPEVPVFLSVQTISTGRLDLVWKRSTNSEVTNYWLYRSTINNTNSLVPIKTNNRNTTNYADASLGRGTVYFYWLRNVNVYGGRSTLSTVTLGTTLAYLPAPILSSVPISTNSIRIAWTDMPNETSYTLFRSYYDNPAYSDFRKGFIPNITQYTDKPLLPNLRYYYWIKQYVNGIPSILSSVTTNRVLPVELRWACDSPTNRWGGWFIPRGASTIVSKGADTAENVPNTQGMAPISETIFHSGSSWGSNSIKFNVINHVGDDSSVNYCQLIVSSSTNADGKPARNNSENLKSKDISKYNMLSFWIKGDGSGRFGTVNLSASNGKVSTNKVSLYTYLDVNSTAWQKVEIPLSRLTNLIFTKKEFKRLIGVIINSGEREEEPGSWVMYIDEMLFFKTTFLPPPVQPVFTKSLATGTNESRLYWENAINATSYTLYRSTNSLIANAVPVAKGSFLKYFDSSLKANKTYYYWLKAANSTGNSPLSDMVSLTTLNPSDPPLAPYDVTVTLIKLDVAELKWSDLPGETKYKVYRSSVNDTNSAVLIATLNANSIVYRDKGLSPDTTYYYWVRSQNVNGLSVYPVAVQITTISPLDEGDVRVCPNYITPDVNDVTFKFRLPKPGSYSFYMYNVAGDLVWSQRVDAIKGSNSIDWDKKNKDGNLLGSGLYILYIKGAGMNKYTKFILKR